jgi:ferritin-like metal-binding protein YciE
MKSSINNLYAVLTFQLEEMHDIEECIESELMILLQHISNAKLKSTVRQYVKSSKLKKIKLKRIFSYLLRGPFLRKGQLMKEIVKGLTDINKRSSDKAKDVLVATSLTNLIQYKLGAYQEALEMAACLELEEASDLLNEILLMENEPVLSLKEISGQLISELANQEAFILE